MSKDFLGLKGKVAIVTGASSGIGEATALRLAEAGCSVVLAARREGRIKKLELRIKKNGGKVLGVVTDVTKKEDVENLVRVTLKKFGKIDILVNNAGILEMEPFLQITDASFQRVMDTNLRGYLWVGQAVARVMAKQKSGRIINVSSIAGYGAFSGITSYNLSKAAIVMLTKNMATELGPLGIAVNGLAPGVIVTEMTTGMLSDKKQVKGFLEKIPLKRLGEGVDMANTIIFLASDLCSYTTGHTVISDGGWTAHL